MGGFDPRTLIAQRVNVHAESGDLVGVIGSRPIHVLSEDEKGKKTEIKDLFIDLGLPGEKVVDLVGVGDMVTLQRDFTRIGEAVTAKALDDRVGVYVMIEALRLLTNQEPNVDVYAVATAQEEVGLRGAITSSFGIQPDFAVALDVTIASDVPDTKPHQHVSKLGGGVAIKLMDSASISHPGMVKTFRDLATQHEIDHQLEILPRGGTDAGGIQRSRAGTPVITLSVPTRYVHSTVEMAHQEDIRGAARLLAKYLKVAHERP